jgi:hypothetical protein
MVVVVGIIHGNRPNLEKVEPACNAPTRARNQGSARNWAEVAGKGVP